MHRASTVTTQATGSGGEGVGKPIALVNFRRIAPGSSQRVNQIASKIRLLKTVIRRCFLHSHRGDHGMIAAVSAFFLKTGHGARTMSRPALRLEHKVLFWRLLRGASIRDGHQVQEILPKS